MRAFVAIPLDEPVKDALVRAADMLRPGVGNVRWANRETMHVTLKFLGEINAAQCDRMRSLLRETRQRATEIEIRGVGHFAGRVVWAGCQGDLAALASAIERAAVTIGVPPEARAFHAHVTLGRSRSAQVDRSLAALLESHKDDPIAKQTANAFVMYKSTLTPKGPIYEVIETFALTA